MQIHRLLLGTEQQAMYAVGVIEVVAGIAVAVALRFGAWLVAAWLAGIIVDLLSFRVSASSRPSERINKYRVTTLMACGLSRELPLKEVRRAQ